MTDEDRELIELAAKACKLPECGWMAETFTYVKDNTFTSWEPLIDDGAALRLAADLKIDVWHRPGHVGASGRSDGIRSHEAEQADRATATRRAIVKAAAAMAKAPDRIAGMTRPMNDRGQGRKPLKEGVDSVIVPIRMTPAQKAKLKLLGGAQWMRDKIDRASLPTTSKE